MASDKAQNLMESKFHVIMTYHKILSQSNIISQSYYNPKLN